MDEMRALYGLSSLLLLIAAAPSQSKGGQAPKPRAGVAPLGYYVGTWQGHGKVGGEAELASHFTCDWFSGGFQVVCRGEESGPTGKRAFINIKSFDSTDQTYSEYSASSMGETEYNQGGKLAGDKMVYLIDQTADGKASTIRYTETRLSPDAMTYEAEVSSDGGPWKEMARGELNRVAP